MDKKARISLWCSAVFVFVIIVSLMYFVLADFVDDGSAVQNVTDCGILNTSGATYTLNQSIDSGADGNCLIIANESIILDCAGHNITFGNSSGGVGILNMEPSGAGFTNVTIKNCIILDNTTAFNTTAIIFGENSSAATIFNNTITTDQEEVGGMFFDINLTNSNISSNTFTISGNNSVGISLMAGSDTVIDSNDITILGNLSSAIVFMDGTTNSNITSNNINISVSDPEETTAILLIETSNSNLLYNNTITTSGGGIIIQESTDTNLTSNTIISSVFNASAVYLTGANSSILEYNNITTSNNLSIAIVLTELINTLINLNNITTSNASAIGIVADDETTDSNITSNTVTTSGDDARGIYLSMESNNMRIISNTINTSGEDASGITIGDNSTNVTIFDNTIVTYGNFSSSENSSFGGIFLDIGTTVNVSSNNITTSGIGAEGIWIWESSNHTVDSNTITTTGEKGDGIYLINIQGTNLTSNTISISGISADGIHSQFSQNSSLLFYSNVITTSANYSYGIYLQGDDLNNISSNNITTSGNASYGIYFNQSHHATLAGNIIKTGEADSYVLYLLIASNHSVYNNIFNTSTNGSGVYFVPTCSLSYFNTTEAEGTVNIMGGPNSGGNFWTNSTSTGYSDTCTDADGDYFCDIPYVIYPGLLHKDYLPLADHTDITYECGTLSTANRTYTLNQSISTTGTCFTISANNITLDFDGFNITGNTTGYGVNVTSYNDTTIQDGEIYNFSIGINFEDNVNNNITNMTSNNNYQGIAFTTSSNNNLTTIIVSDNVANGILLETSLNNVFTDVIAHSNNHLGIYVVAASSNNIFTDININYSGIGLAEASGNAFINTNISNSTTDAVLLQYDTSDDNNFTNVIVTNTSSSKYDINFSTAGIDGTWIIGISNFANYSFAGAGGKVNFKEPSFGEIVFLEAINGNGTDLSSDVDIEDEWVFVNSSSNSGLNKSANISFYEVSFTDPKPQYSPDNVTWTDCTNTTNPACVEFTYTEGETFKFNVSHFTYFKIIEGYSAPADDDDDDDDDSTGGGGGAPPFWLMTHIEDGEEFSEKEEVTKELKARHRIKLKIDDEAHYVGVIELDDTTATINVSSDPQQVVFSVGDLHKFEVTGDDYYDLSVTLNSINSTSDKANLTIKTISEEVIVETEECTPDWNCTEWSDCINGTKTRTCTDLNTCGTDEDKPDESKACGAEAVKKNWLWILIGVVVAIAIVVGIVLAKRKK